MSILQHDYLWLMPPLWSQQVGAQTLNTAKHARQDTPQRQPMASDRRLWYGLWTADNQRVGPDCKLDSKPRK